MGLDVYVGTLTRYYSGDWETIIEQISHEQEGIDIRVIHANEPQTALVSQDKIRKVILDWRGRLSKELQDKISTPLNWNESADALYFTDKLTWDSYFGLLLWAAYSEHPNMNIPSFLTDDWSTDPAYQASMNEEFHCNYDQLLYDPELWLPCDFKFTFPTIDINGKKIIVGSTKTLLSQLNNLNKSTWKADDSTLEKWLQNGAERGATLETHARFAFSLVYELAKLSVNNNLPMKLDY